MSLATQRFRVSDASPLVSYVVPPSHPLCVKPLGAFTLGTTSSLPVPRTWGRVRVERPEEQGGPAAR